MTDKPTSTTTRAKAQQLFKSSERDQWVKEENAKQRAQLDTKMAKLRALRLEKDARDKEASALEPPPKPKKSRVKAAAK
jgi:hypothetical protein